MENNFLIAKEILFITIIIGVYFTFLQAFEYIEAPFIFQDSSYGRTFFIATGFHGIHVLIGTTFLLTTLYQFNNFFNTPYHIIGFETAA
jgi:heme/copper-type cytochrome/quinol oxidase subunit 3